MDNSFDEAYTRYQSFLAKLDETSEVSEKNLLFRELAEQLSEMEQKLRLKREPSVGKEEIGHHSELTYWI